MNQDTRSPLPGSALLICLLVAATSAHAQQPGWSRTGSFGSPHVWHTATLLANGKVLVAGGTDYFTNSNPYWRGIGSAELYDPATGTWSPTGSMNRPRGGHAAVRLANGKVLVVGGDNGYRMPVTQAEIYDPETGVWSEAGDVAGDWFNTATLLTDGRVLVRGLNATLYDPTTGLWAKTGAITGRSWHAAFLLPGGQVLVTGGGSAELFDPATGNWKPTGNLNTAHYWDQQAALLPNGNVLVFGGGISGDDYCNGINTAEVYDAALGTWSLTENAISTRNDYGMASYSVVLPNGKVLVAGGLGPGCKGLKSADLYDPATGKWSATASMTTARSGHTVTLLANGTVLVAGGDAGNTAEIYDSNIPGITTVSAASLGGNALARESIVSGFGLNLAPATELATTEPLPTELTGVTVKVRDSIGVERLAPLFFVSPEQINFQVPPGTANGLANVAVTRGGSLAAASTVEIVGVAPGLFTADGSGTGLAAASVFRRKADGSVLYEAVTQPIDLRPATDQVFLLLYGTGIRFRSEQSAVIATIGGTTVDVLYAGAAPGLLGVDQVSVRLPRSLAGRGDVEITLSVDGNTANPVHINIR